MMFHTPQKRVPPLELKINGMIIEKVQNFNFLGLVLDTHLKWNPHVQKVASKISQINGILSKLKYIFPQRILRMIYNSLIESHINYCLIVWGTNYDRVFKLQKKAIRTISLQHAKSHTSPLFKSLELLDVRDMHTVHLLKLYYKIKIKIIPPYFANFIVPIEPPAATRYNLRHIRINIPIPRREYKKRNVKYQLNELIRTFDQSLLQRADNYSLKSYVNRIKLHFLEEYQINCNIHNCYACNLE